MKLPIVGAAYNSRVPDLNNQTCINWYPISGGPDGKEVMALVPTPGYEVFVDLGDNGPVRGAFSHENVGYVVSSNTFYSVTSAGVATAAAQTLSTSTGRCFFEANSTQIMVVDGTFGYIYTIATGALVQISSPNFPATAEYLTYQDGYFIVVSAGRFYWSSLNDGETWAATDVATPTYKADALLATLSFKEDLIMFGRRTIEFYVNDGITPFSRRTGSTLLTGIAAKESIAAGANFIVGLTRSESGQLEVMALGISQYGSYAPQIISNDAVSEAIAQYTVVSDAFGFVYTEHTHVFYVLTFPSEGVTWVVDLSAQGFPWHQRQSKLIATSLNGADILTRWTPNCYMSLANQHIVGDHETGILYQLKSSLYAENSRVIRRSRRTQHIFEEDKPITIYRLLLELKSAVGLVTGQGSDPQLILRYSTDGGNTWSPEQWRTPGKVGEYQIAAVWDMLGMGRDWVFEISTSDPVDFSIIGAYARVSLGAQ